MLHVGLLSSPHRFFFGKLSPSHCGSRTPWGAKPSSLLLPAATMSTVVSWFVSIAFPPMVVAVAIDCVGSGWRGPLRPRLMVTVEIEPSGLHVSGEHAALEPVRTRFWASRLRGGRKQFEHNEKSVDEDLFAMVVFGIGAGSDAGRGGGSGGSGRPDGHGGG